MPRKPAIAYADPEGDKVALVWIEEDLEQKISDVVEEHKSRDIIHMPALIAHEFGGSCSDARRTIAQGGVKLDGETLIDYDLPEEELQGKLLQVGKLRSTVVDTIPKLAGR